MERTNRMANEVLGIRMARQSENRIEPPYRSDPDDTTVHWQSVRNYDGRKDQRQHEASLQRRTAG